MKKYAHISTLIILLLTSISIYAQQAPNLKPEIPTSPQAEVLTRRGEFTSINSSGIPDISIPLFTFNHHGFTIPFTMRYMPHPLKPGYNYDVCGLGWSINNTYCISRTIVSHADEESDFRLNYIDIEDRYIKDVYKELSDYNISHDKFHATLPTGESFDFVINNESGTLEYIYQSPSVVSIECSYGKGNISSFTIKDVNGIVYLFSTADWSMSTDENRTRKVAWYLDRISFPDKSPITFTYNQSIKLKHARGIEEPILKIGETFYPELVVQNTDAGTFTSGGYTPTVQVYKSNGCVKYQTKLLTSIQCESETVKFTYENSSEETDYNYLTKISGSTNRKEITLDYKKTYSMGGDGNGDSLACLSKLYISGIDNTTAPDIYKFEYTGVGGFQNGTDHWGNLTTNINTNGIANFNIFVNNGIDDCESESFYFLGSIAKEIKKDSDDLNPYLKFNLYYKQTYGEFRSAGNANSHCLLSKMTYPNGGCTQFIFENHKFKTHTLANGDYVFDNSKRRTVEGGGFRTKYIINYNADGTLADEYEYTYGEEVNKIPCGWGEPVVDPNILTYTTCTSSPYVKTPIYNMLLGISPKYNIYNGPYGISSELLEKLNNPQKFSLYFDRNNEWYWDANISPLNFRALLGGKEAVVYPQITVRHAGGSNLEKTLGKTVYTFDIYTNGQSGKILYDEPYITDNVVVRNQKDYMQNSLLTKTVYEYINGSYSLKSIDSNSYEDVSTSYDDAYESHFYDYNWYPKYSVLGSAIRCHSNYMGYKRLTGTTKTLYTEYDKMDNGSYYCSYNKYNLLKSKSYTGIYKTTEKFTYSCDIDSASIAKNMSEKYGIHSALVGYTKNVGGKTVKDEKIQYAKFVNGEKVDTTSVGSIFKPCAVYDNVLVGPHTGYKLTTQILSYNDYGKPKEIIDESGTHVVYLWTNEDNLAAVIKNTTAATVGAILNNLGSNCIYSVNGLLQLQSALSGTLFTGYTYTLPHQLSAMIAENGSTIHYSYDGLGRLIEEYYYEDNDSAKKFTLKQYTYHNSSASSK